MMPDDAAAEENEPDAIVVTPDEESEEGPQPALISPAALEADAELDKLLDEMSRDERGETTAAAKGTPTAAAAGPGADAAPGAVAPAGADQSEPTMSAAERDALSLAGIGAEADAADERDAAEAAARAEAGPAALPVRILEAVNAPLAFVPDRLRDVLGKIAILTLVNSLAVLIYVLFIRR